jgi:uncharacterized protein YoxC
MTIFELLQIILYVLAFIVSCVTIWFVVKQFKETIKHNKLSIKPVLSGYVYVTGKNKVIVTIKNNSFGIAILTGLKLILTDRASVINRG